VFPGAYQQGVCSLPDTVCVVLEIDRFGELFAVQLPFLNFPIFALIKAATRTIRARVRVVV
jgi:hypothetical protein